MDNDPEKSKDYAERSPTSSTTNEKRDDNVSPKRKVSVYQKLQNPLAEYTRDELLADVEAFAREKGLEDELHDLRRGALIAKDPQLFETMSELDEEDKQRLRDEWGRRWHVPWMMYFMTILCAGSAIVQGMDQSAVNGAQRYYFLEFDIGENQVWLRGLLNGAPYLCSVLIGCWSTKPLNYYFGRRGCIFISCVISFITGIWMAVANSWPNLLVARFALGFAVGAKSSTTPVYGAECSPTPIRGALVMMWQMWTAFGIMLGFIASLAFGYVEGNGGIESIQYLNWRLMLGSTSIPPGIVMCMVYLVPESPRWYMTKNKYGKAYKSLCRFRSSKLQAARDLYYIHKGLVVEMEQKEGKNLIWEMFARGRNRRAAQSSFFVMFMQQFCGVNVIAYYSTAIFERAGFGEKPSLAVSLGTGVINWLFAIPAVYTIDTFGRRNLLLTTYPLMGLCLLFTGLCFLMPAGEARLGCIATGIYLFMVFYSPGEGPVPFTYSAEAFPLYIREYGMAFATATTWGFNFVLSLTWPALEANFTPTGAFGFYACWNFAGWVFCYFALPETKALSLEELDLVFSKPTHEHASYYTKKLPWYTKKYLLRQDVPTYKPLYED